MANAAMVIMPKTVVRWRVTAQRQLSNAIIPKAKTGTMSQLTRSRLHFRLGAQAPKLKSFFRKRVFDRIA